MRVIVFTKEEFLLNESQLIIALLQNGADRVHIRKPNASKEDMRALIGEIPASLRARLTLHDNFDLAEELGIGGVQLNSRNPIAEDRAANIVSRSCHSLSELESSKTLDYLTLSPINNSISKEGYNTPFTKEELLDAKLRGVLNNRVYALGGVTPKDIFPLFAMGFGGVALLGYIWQDLTIEGVTRRIKEASQRAKMCRDFNFQFITHLNERYDYLSGVKEALEGGCRWVQLRMKEATDAQMVETGLKLRELCDQYNATFLLNDRVHLVKECGADGVHIGKNDLSPNEAREILGDRYIIGSTVNSCADLENLTSQSVDYIGVGPFRFTTTKKNLSPIIGLEGYRDMLRYEAQRAITLPIVAIGGVTKDDIGDIMAQGVSGIALSGTVLNSERPAEESREIKDILTHI